MTTAELKGSARKYSRGTRRVRRALLDSTRPASTRITGRARPDPRLPVSPSAGHVLLLGSQPDADLRITGILQAHGLRVSASADADAGMAMAVSVQLVVIDGLADAAVAISLCERLRAASGLADMPILCVASSADVGERVHLLEAGADDVIARPFDTTEFEARVDGLLARTKRGATLTERPGPASPEGDVPRSIAFFGPKGGSGTTTLAVNVAVALAARRAWSVALVDLDLQWGDVTMLLNIVARHTVSDLAHDSVGLADRDMVRRYAVQHQSGLAVYGSAARPDDSASVTAGNVSQLLAALRDTYQVVIVDAGSALDAVSQTIIEHADRLVIPVIPEIPGLRAVRTLLEMLAESDRGSENLVLVLNHIFPRDMMRREEIEGALGGKVEIELPHDPVLYLVGANAGEPIVTSAPKSAPGDRLLALSALLAGDGATTATSARPGDARQRFSSLLKRG